MRRGLHAIGLVGAVTLVAAGAWAAGPQSMHLEGIAVTGFNRLQGQTIFDFTDTLGTIGFNSFGAYNPDGNRALPLTPDSPPDTLLATIVDPFFLFPGQSEDDVAGELNVPLRNVGVIVDSSGLVRVPLPDHLSAGQLQRSQAAPNDPITLGNWLEAKGKGVIHCGHHHPPSVKLIMDGLIPHGVYTVWEVLSVNKTMFALPLGGSPSAFVPDARGRATFERQMNFCPLDLAPGEHPLVQIDVIWHSDHRLFGTRPNLPRARLYEGTVTHTHLEFPVADRVRLLP
jgi:hypothetical protein